MMLDLTDDEARALAKHLRQTIDYARFPLAPRLDPLKSILAKQQYDLPTPLKPDMGASAVGRRPSAEAVMNYAFLIGALVFF